MKHIQDIDIAGKRVLLRVDFNVPLREGVIGDDTRIREALPTIQYCFQKNAKVLLLTHLGRPKVVNSRLRLFSVARRVQELSGRRVEYLPDIMPARTDFAILENIRFWPEEEKNDPEFCKRLAALGDVYVNDAFATAHRAHASTEGLAHLLPHAAGLLMQKEIEHLSKLLKNPERPFIALIGGAKISTKIGLLKNLLNKVDGLLLGGALANTVLLAQNHEVGASLVEKDSTSLVQGLLSNKLKIPVDVLIHDGSVRGVGDVSEGDKICDIGPDTILLYREIMMKAKTIVWNGPMGVSEQSPFDQGTLHMARAVTESSAYSVAGGGETVEALEKLGVKNDISFVSTGGGAMLEFLEGKELPGIKALE